jgi:hypothetical protein
MLNSHYLPFDSASSSDDDDDALMLMLRFIENPSDCLPNPFVYNIVYISYY